MKISILTREIKESKTISNVKKASEIASSEKSDLLILPGYYPFADPPTSTLQEIKKLSIQNNINILAEALDKRERSTFLFEQNTGSSIKFFQYFARGNDKKEKYKELNKAILNKERDFTIKNKTIRVLLCGENNYFKNERHNISEVNKVNIRYDDLLWDDNYDILINPAHSTMGQWNLLNKRFSKLSEQNKIVIYTTNKGRENSPVNSWGTALRVYKNKELLIDGELRQKIGTIHIDKHWRMTTINI